MVLTPLQPQALQRLSNRVVQCVMTKLLLPLTKLA
jgi:hypothetical protein